MGTLFEFSSDAGSDPHPGGAAEPTQDSVSASTTSRNVNHTAAPLHPKPPVTYKRRHGLTVTQRNALDLLVSGLTDPTVAKRVGVSRTTVTKWRLYDPLFQFELDRLRRKTWSPTTDGLRAVLPDAINSIRRQLGGGPNPGRFALDLILKAGLMGRPYSGDLARAHIGPTTMEELIDQEVLRQRAASHRIGSHALPLDAPITEAERDAAYDYLEARRLADPEDSDDEDDPAYDGDPSTRPTD